MWILPRECACSERTELLTNRMNVEEAHRRAQEGVEHAVVQSLCRHHQDVEVNQAAQEAKQDGGRGQT